MSECMQHPETQKQDATLRVHPEIERLCRRHGVRPVLMAALEALLRSAHHDRRLTPESMENLMVCERAEILPTGDGDVLVRLVRGERKGFLHFENDIARFGTASLAWAFIGRYREDLLPAPTEERWGNA